MASDSTLENALRAANEITTIKKVLMLDPNSKSSIQNLTKLATNPKLSLPIKVDPELDVSFIGFSSGTTGQPKSILRSPRSTVAYRVLAKEPFCFGVGTDARCILPVPLYHLADVSILFNCLLNGCTMILQSHAKKSLDFADKYKATCGFVVPAEINYYAKNMINQKLDTIRDLLVTGSQPSKQVSKAFQSKFNIPLVRNGYGSSEMSWLAFFPANYRGNEISNLACSGFVLPGVEVKFVDRESGLPVGPRAIGEICARSPQLFTKYLDNDEANSDSFDSEGYFKSGKLYDMSQ